MKKFKVGDKVLCECSYEFGMQVLHKHGISHRKLTVCYVSLSGFYIQLGELIQRNPHHQLCADGFSKVENPRQEKRQALEDALHLVIATGIHVERHCSVKELAEGIYPDLTEKIAKQQTKVDECKEYLEGLQSKVEISCDILGVLEQELEDLQNA